jgi:hypothetical protein
VTDIPNTAHRITSTGQSVRASGLLVACAPPSGAGLLMSRSMVGSAVAPSVGTSLGGFGSSLAGAPRRLLVPRGSAAPGRVDRGLGNWLALHRGIGLGDRGSVLCTRELVAHVGRAGGLGALGSRTRERHECLTQGSLLRRPCSGLGRDLAADLGVAADNAGQEAPALGIGLLYPHETRRREGEGDESHRRLAMVGAHGGVLPRRRLANMPRSGCSTAARHILLPRMRPVPKTVKPWHNARHMRQRARGAV